MKQSQFAFLAALVATIALAPTAHAGQFRLPEEIGRVEAPRDTNIFQVEPTVLDERYYLSGRSERSQFVGNVLPPGAPIPDTDSPVAAPKAMLIRPVQTVTAPPAVQPAQIRTTNH